MIKTKYLAAGAHYWVYNPDATETIVAVHGLRGTHHGLELIAKSLPKYRFIIPDLPGFGKSAPFATKPHDVKNYANWLTKFIKELSLDKPPILLGHSFGSLVAGEYAAKYPKNISKLILINSIAKHGNPLGGALSKGYYKLSQILPEKFGTNLLKSRLVVIIMTEVMITSKNPSMRKMIYDQHFKYFGTFASRTSVYETFHATMSGSVLRYADKLTMPTLLIAGLQDKLAPIKGQKQFHDVLPNSQLKILETTGHLSQYETPEAIATSINAFLTDSDK